MAINQQQSETFGNGIAESLQKNLFDPEQQRQKAKLALAMESSRLQQEDQIRQHQMRLGNQLSQVPGNQAGMALGMVGANSEEQDRVSGMGPFHPATLDTLIKARAGQNRPVSASLGLRDNQFWQKQWVDTGKDMDISKASSRTPLGVAATNNVKSQRALKLLNSDKTFTPQDLNLVTTDVSSIMKGGSPDEQLLRQQQYGTYYGNGIQLLQQITANPRNLNVPGIRQHLKDVIEGVIGVDNGVINDHINSIESTRADVISRRPKDWENLKNKVLANTISRESDQGLKNNMSDIDAELARRGVK